MTWRKARRCATNACVEVEFMGFRKSSYSGDIGAEIEAVRVRDGKNRSGPMLTFTPTEWRAFIDGAKAGEFDQP